MITLTKCRWLKGGEKLEGQINGIYQSYINSAEYEEKAKKNDIDISWIVPKLSPEDYLKLEESIVKYYANNGEIIFNGGFRFAWKLFMECNSESGSEAD
jgi:hypothetical protein